MSEGKHIVDLYIEAHQEARDAKARIAELELEVLNLRTERDAAHIEVADRCAQEVAA